MLDPRHGVMDCVLWGFPLTHTYSPWLHHHFATTTGMRLVYRADPVETADFVSHARRFFERGGWGANVTLPHKVSALALADALDDEAALCGAVNTLYRRGDQVRGANTDVTGLQRELLSRQRLSQAAPLRLAIIGAGGAARAAAFALYGLCERIEIVLRDRSRGMSFLKDLEKAGISVDAVHGLSDVNLSIECDVLVDATSAWVRGERWSLPRGAVPPGAFFYTMSYGSQSEPFRAMALCHQPRAILDGWGLLVEQAAASFALWTGVRPSTDALHGLSDRDRERFCGSPAAAEVRSEG